MALSVWAFAQRSVQADDPATKSETDSSKACKSCQLQAGIKISGLPMFAKIPYLNRLFATPEDAACEANGSEKFERIGVDFEFLPPGIVCMQSELPACCKECLADNCCHRELAGNVIYFQPANHEACAASDCQSGKAECLAAGCSGGQECPLALPANQQALAAAKDVLIRAKNCASAAGHTCCVDAAAVTELRQQVAELTAQKAALEMALETHAEFVDFQEDTNKEMLSLLTEKLELQFKLELVEKMSSERERNSQQIAEMTAENRHLKSLIEVAEIRQASERAQLELALENERLKLRVEGLEKLAESTQQGPRTARKTSGGKRMR